MSKYGLAAAHWRIRVDDEGPILWMFDAEDKPLEAFQPCWEYPNANWRDVLLSEELEELEYE